LVSLSRRRTRKPVRLVYRSHGQPSARVAFSAAAVRPKNPVDPWLLFVVVTLAMVGLIVVYAATYHQGSERIVDHLIRAGLGLVALFIGMKLRYTVLAGRLGWLLLGVVLILMVITAVSGRAAGVAHRWLPLLRQLSIQPAEIAKFVLPMWLAAYFASLKEKPDKKWNAWHSLGKPGLVAFGFIGLTAAQPAVGTTAIMAVSSLLLFVLVGVKLRYLVPVGVLAGVALVVLVWRVPYAHKRWNEFVRGECWQQQQSLIAIGSGGVFGKGLGEGKQKFYFLSKLDTDFAVASVGEEFGFVGGLAIFLLYGVFLVRGMQTARRSTHHFGQYLASGIVITLFMYALVHIAVALGWAPTTGQPLPFVSYGGSALVTNLFAAGVVLNISRYARRPDESNAGRGWNRRAHLSRARARA